MSKIIGITLLIVMVALAIFGAYRSCSYEWDFFSGCRKNVNGVMTPIDKINI